MTEAPILETAPKHFCRYDSPLGSLTMGGVGDHLLWLHFPRDGQPVLPSEEWVEDEHAFANARQQLEAYFDGTLKHFTVPYELRGSPFQLSVWNALEAIPFGAVKSYGDIAKAVGQPGGAQAVGMANNANPLPIIVPCHRVIGADGSLVGFGGGMEAKIWLLEHEGINPSQVHSPDQLGFSF